MPELPEVETTKQTLSSLVVGEKIIKFSIYNRRLRWTITGEEAALQNRIISLVRRGKYLIFELEHASWIMVHLGMSGSLRIANPLSSMQKHEHWSCDLASGVQMRYQDPRRFGCLLFGKNQSWQEHPLINHLGLEPLSENFNDAYLYQKLSRRTLPIKQAIMDSKVVVGVGNIYANEALFCSKIHPQFSAKSLTLKQLDQLAICIKKILKDAITKGGSTLRDYRNGAGEIGYFQQKLTVYDRKNKACKTPKCPAQIQRLILANRSSFYCPKCQSL